MQYLHVYLKWETMGISCILAIPMIITCLLQGILCDTGIPRTFHGGKICSVEASNTSKQFLSDHKFWILQSDRAPTPMTSNSFVYFYFPFVRSAFCKKISDSWPGMIISLLWLTALLMFSNLIQIMEFTVQVF